MAARPCGCTNAHCRKGASNSSVFYPTLLKSKRTDAGRRFIEFFTATIPNRNTFRNPAALP
jgi:hypothetical protein